MSKTKYSISAASRIIGKSRATISRHMASGKLSFNLENDGNKTLSADELLRVYGDECHFDREEKRGKASTTQPKETSSTETALLKKVQDQLIAQYVSQVEHLQQALDKSQEGQNRVTLLLEQRTSETTDWQRSIESMTQDIANQTQSQIKSIQEQHGKEINQLKRVLHNERNKSFWKRLFG